MTTARRRIASTNATCFFANQSLAFILAHDWLDHWADMGAWHKTSKTTRAFLELVLLPTCTTIRTRCEWKKETISPSVTYLLFFTRALRVLELPHNMFAFFHKMFVGTIRSVIVRNMSTLRSVGEYGTKTDSEEIDWPDDDAENVPLSLFSCPAIESIRLPLAFTSGSEGEAEFIKALVHPRRLRHLTSIELDTDYLKDVITPLVFGEKDGCAAESKLEWTRPLKQLRIDITTPCCQDLPMLSKLTSLTHLAVKMGRAGSWEKLAPLLHHFPSLVKLRITAKLEKTRAEKLLPDQERVKIELPNLDMLRIRVLGSISHNNLQSRLLVHFVLPALTTAKLYGFTLAEEKTLCYHSPRLRHLRLDGVCRAITDGDGTPAGGTPSRHDAVRCGSLETLRFNYHGRGDETLLFGLLDAPTLRAIAAPTHDILALDHTADPAGVHRFFYLSVVQAELAFEITSSLEPLDNLVRMMPNLVILKLECTDLTALEGLDNGTIQPQWHNLRVLAFPGGQMTKCENPAILQRLLLYCPALEVLVVDSAYWTIELIETVSKYASATSLREVCFDGRWKGTGKGPIDKDLLLPHFRTLMTTHPKLCSLRCTDESVQSLINEHLIFQGPTRVESLPLLMNMNIDVETIRLVKPDELFRIK